MTCMFCVSFSYITSGGFAPQRRPGMKKEDKQHSCYSSGLTQGTPCLEGRAVTPSRYLLSEFKV